MKTFELTFKDEYPLEKAHIIAPNHIKAIQVAKVDLAAGFKKIVKFVELKNVKPLRKNGSSKARSIRL